jgi:SAM-dependent methyltransferase
MTIKQAILKLLPGFVVRKYLEHKSRKRMKGYEGNGVECPACGSTFRIFAPTGTPLRENAKCPRCEFAERGRLMFLYLTETSDLFVSQSKKKMLHFGPEKLFYDKFSKLRNIEYIPCDLFPEKYIFGGKIKVQKVDITMIPFEDHSFDFILCSHILEHIPDDALAMSELHRVMKPGGWGIFQVPIDYSREKTYEDFSITTPEGRMKAFGQGDHVRWYGIDYVNRLEKAGFKVTADDFVRKFSDEELCRYGLDKNELIYRCDKKQL